MKITNWEGIPHERGWERRQLGTQRPWAVVRAPTRVMTGEGSSEGRPRSCPGLARESQLCCHRPISGLGREGEVRDALWSHAGQKPERHPPPWGAVTAAPLPQGERAAPPTLLRPVGPRVPPAPRPTHRGLRSPSDKPWPRCWRSPRARCAASWVRILIRQLLRFLGTDPG